MKSPRDEKTPFKAVGRGLLIIVAGFIIFTVFSAWQSMSRNGNESNAVFFISSIKKAQDKFAAVHQGKFAPNFDELIKLADLDKRLNGEKPTADGYVFEMKFEESNGTKPAFYTINADPRISEGLFSTATRHFYFDSSLGTIKSTEENRPAKADDPSI